MKLKRTAPPPDTCVIYCRVSTDAQERDGTSLDTQEAACRDYAAAHGWHVIAVVRDTASGATLDRPALEAARTQMRAGDAAVLLVYAVDRLTREQHRFGVLAEEAERYGFRLEAVSEPIEETSIGKFLGYVRSFVGELEREKIRERTMRGKKAKLANGKLVGAGPEEVYGYELDRTTWRRCIVEAEAVVVRRIYDLCGGQGYGVKAIATVLHSEGLRTRHGAVWSGNGVWRILRNPAYQGQTVAWRWQKDPRTHQIARRKAEDHILLPSGVTPAIVTVQAWQAAQATLASNKGEKARNKERPELLRGLLFCADCGRRCYPRASGGRTVYRCAGTEAVANRCTARGISGRIAEAAVWQQLRRLLRSEKLMSAAIARWRGTQPQRDTARLAVQRAELARVQEAQERLVRAMTAAAGMAEDAFARELGRLDAQRRALVVSVAELERQEAEAAVQAVMLREVHNREWRQRWLANLDGLGFDGQRDALTGLAVRVMVSETQLEIQGRIPLAGVGSDVVGQTSAGSPHNVTFGIPFALTVARPQKAA